MKLIDLLYVLNKDSWICIANNTKDTNVWGQKRKAGNITMNDLQRIGNHDVMSAFPGKDGCLYIHIWDRSATITNASCYKAIRTAKRNGTL